MVAILVLAFLIFIHELGHFLLAKWCGVGVVEFAVGFGKPLLKKKIGETTYALRLIPLGGYVRMVGDDPREFYGEPGAAPEPRLDAASDVPVDEALLNDRSRWLLSKGFVPKALIVLAGPAFNLITAIVLAIASLAIFGQSVPVDRPQIGAVFPGLPAEKSGLKEGDIVLSINGEPVADWQDLAHKVSVSEGREMTFVVQRPKEVSPPETEEMQLKLTAIPEPSEMRIMDEPPAAGDPPRAIGYKIGIVASTEVQPATLQEAFIYGPIHVYLMVKGTLRGFWGMLTGVVSASNVGGPVFIFGETARAARRGSKNLVDFIVFLSVSLAVLNLLPIPVLDGGHLLFFILEAIKGGPISLKIQRYATQFGLAVILALMVLGISNDIRRLL